MFLVCEFRKALWLFTKQFEHHGFGRVVALNMLNHFIHVALHLAFPLLQFEEHRSTTYAALEHVDGQRPNNRGTEIPIKVGVASGCFMKSFERSGIDLNAHLLPDSARQIVSLCTRKGCTYSALAHENNGLGRP